MNKPLNKPTAVEQMFGNEISTNF